MSVILLLAPYTGDIDLLIYPDTDSDPEVCNEIMTKLLKVLVEQDIITDDLAYPTNVHDDDTNHDEHDEHIDGKTNDHSHKRKRTPSSLATETKTVTSSHPKGHEVHDRHKPRQERNSYTYEGICHLLLHGKTKKTATHHRLDIKVLQ